MSFTLPQACQFDGSSRSNRKIVTLLVAFAFLTGCGSSLTEETEQIATFDTTLAQQMEQALEASVAENNATGAVLAVRAPDGSTWITATGNSIEENATAMQTDLYFRIGSITKTFTSTLTLMLIDQGLLTLDTTLEEVVPELGVVMSDQITVADLLDMRSGLIKYLANEDFSGFITYDPGRIWTPEELVYYTNVAVSEPGDTFLYNNGNYILLGLIIEKVTGLTYEEALARHILTPLGLHHTMMPENGNMPEPFANGYQYSSDGNLTTNLTYNLNPSIAWSAGGLVSNAEDLLTWSEAYIDGTLLSVSMHEQQFTLQSVTEEENPAIEGYGYGVMQDGILIGHDGFIPPYGSWVATYDNYEFVLLVNGTRNSALEPVYVTTTILDDVINAVDGQL